MGLFLCILPYRFCLLLLKFKADMIGSPSLIILKQPPMRRSYATRTVKNFIALDAILGSASTTSTWEVDTLADLVTSFTRGVLMERAVYKLSGVSAIGVTVF